MKHIHLFALLATLVWSFALSVRSDQASSVPTQAERLRQRHSEKSERLSYAERLQKKREESNTKHQRQALARIKILSLLHDGKTNEAIDAMETVLDTAICTSWERASKYAGSAKESEIEFLRQMQEYRQRYPRTSTDDKAVLAATILNGLKAK